MAVPKYYEMYNIFLECLKDKEVHSLKEIKQIAIEKLDLSEEDLNQMLPSGRQRLFDNRLGWCRAYLKKANLIISPKKAQFQITDRGMELLLQNSKITDETLMKYPEFVLFKTGNRILEDKLNIEHEESTPQEILEKSYQELNDAQANDLLNEILEMDPYKFESLVVDLLIKMGYGKLQFNSKVTKKSNDEGIDGIVTADKLGFDSIYIQAKRYKNNSIGRPEIQKFVGALAGQGAQKGIFITTSNFTKEAIEFTEKTLSYKIVLIDGHKLSDLMIEYDLGVSVEYTYKVKRVDSDYFSED